MQTIAVQLDIAWGDKLLNFDRVEQALSAIDIEPGALIVLPEMFATGFDMDAPRIAEPFDGETDRFLLRLAIETQACILGGLVRRTPDGRFLNVVRVVSPKGLPLAEYAKLHPFTPSGEDKIFAAGDSIGVFDWGGFRVSPFICYDLRFPEVFRAAMCHGANLFTVSASWPEPRAMHRSALLVARAIENQAFVVGVNRVGTDPAHSYVGESMIVDPSGNVLCVAAPGAGVLLHTIDPATVGSVRSQFPVLNDARPDFMPSGINSKYEPKCEGRNVPLDLADRF
jgi:omega-amidase